MFYTSHTTYYKLLCKFNIFTNISSDCKNVKLDYKISRYVLWIFARIFCASKFHSLIVQIPATRATAADLCKYHLDILSRQARWITDNRQPGPYFEIVLDTIAGAHRFRFQIKNPFLVAWPPSDRERFRAWRKRGSCEDTVQTTNGKPEPETMGEKPTGETHREEARLSLVIRINQAYLKRAGQPFRQARLLGRLAARSLVCRWQPSRSPPGTVRRERERERKKKHPLKMYE